MYAKSEIQNPEVENANFHSTEEQDADGLRPQKRKEPPTTEDAEGHKAQKVLENRAIWVTNVPSDATRDELYETFKKYGVIDLSVDKTPRIKMYTGEDGKFNGEVLVVYFRPESVDLAITMMDGYALRPGKEASEGVVKVEPSDNTRRKNPNKEGIKGKMARKDRKQADRNRAELNRQLAEWSDNEEEVRETFAPKKNKWAKNAIMSNVFRPIELEDDPDMYNEVRDDMMMVAEKFGGSVTKLTIFDLEPRGIVLVRFRSIESAEKFQQSHINGTKYNEREVRIDLAEDRPKFRKSTREEPKVNLSDSDELKANASDSDDG